MLDSDSSLVEIFLDERIRFSEEPNDGESTTNLYDAYLECCKEKKWTPLSKIALTKELKHIATESGCFNFIPRRNSKQDSHFGGIVLK